MSSRSVLSSLLAASVCLAGAPPGVETRETADTHIYIKTVPEGATVCVDGQDVGPSPRLFVVPPGTRRVTVTVELDGHEKVQRVVQVDTGAVVRVQFDLRETRGDAAGAEDTLARSAQARADGLAPRDVTQGSARSARARAEGDPSATAGAGTPSKEAAASSETPEQLAARFARAMSQVDTAALREFWHITDDLQLEAAEAILASLTRVQLRKNGPVRIEPVHAGRIGVDQVSAYYVVEAIPPLADGNGPWVQGFEHVDGRWVTQPMPHLRTMAEARTRTPISLGRRAHIKTLIGLRFGTETLDRRIEALRITMEAFRRMAQAPHHLEQYGRLAAPMEESLVQLERLRGKAWTDVLPLILEDAPPEMWGGPEDFLLLFYLEAGDGGVTHTLPFADGSGTLVLERIPCLTEDEVAQALTEIGPADGRPQVRVVLTDPGRKLFAAVTQAHRGKRLAIVVDGAIVSAPVIQAAITGGEAVITGNFSEEEAHRIARALNAYRATCKELLRAMRDNRPADLSPPPGQRAGT